MTPIAQAAAIAALPLGTGAATVSVMSPDIPDMPVPQAAWAPGSALDGKSFTLPAVPQPGDRDQTAVLHFRAGTFQSADCEEYCTFGWSDYQTWTEGEITHFTATARCPTEPHTVVWHGKVVGDDMTVAFSWTTRRWYWTHQITGAGTGTALPPAAG